MFVFKLPSAYEGNIYHFKVRLFLAILLVGFSIMFLLLKDVKVATGCEGLWFQVCGATVLWWEANSDEEISGAIAEIKSFHQLKITNKQEVINNKFGFWSSILISTMTFFIVFIPVYGHSVSLSKRFLVAVLAALFNYIVPITIGKAFGRLHERYSLSIMRVGAFEDINKKEQERYARKVVRSVGFMLFIISAIMQIVPISLN